MDILHFSVHGLIRGQNLELGRDPDTGGQCLYVLELVKALAKHPEVHRVTLITRRITDPKVAIDYAKPHEDLGHGVEIRRIDAGPKLYRRKEVLWRHLDAMVDNTLAWLRRERRVPDLIHAHYADAGYVGRQVAAVLGRPFVYTGHSLGRVKRQRLIEGGKNEDEMEDRYNLNIRIEAEESSLDAAAFVCTSTFQEIEQQYALYSQYQSERMRVIPPGVDLTRFEGSGDPEALASVDAKMRQFLREPNRPPVFAIARADERKNLAGLVKAFAGNPWLRENANLILVGGNRQQIDELSPGARKVWSELLRLIDDYNLWGSCAIPKEHAAAEVPEFFRWAAARHGLFANVAFTEPFGLTLLEASAAGLPLVATHDGGPQDILANCQNGVLVDPLDGEAIGHGMADILSDPHKQSALANQGAKAVREHYSWSTHVAHYVKELQWILPAKKSPRRHIGSSESLANCERWVVMDLPTSLKNETPEMLARWHDLFADGSVGFGVTSGMSYDQVRTTLEELDAPRPAFVISSLGAKIHYHPGDHDRGVCDEVWQRQVDAKWNREQVMAALQDVTGLTLQPAENQQEMKVSYFRDEEIGPTRRELHHFLREHGVAAKVLITAGLYLDIIPVRSGKDVALRYLLHKWGIDPSSVLYFATQGNDASVMRGRMLAIIAAEADPQLALLKERTRIKLATQSGLAGLFEGLTTYGFLEGKKPPTPNEAPLSDQETFIVEELLP